MRNGREAFEKWYRSNYAYGPLLGPYGDNPHYENEGDIRAYEAWKAARAESAKEIERLKRTMPISEDEFVKLANINFSAFTPPSVWDIRCFYRAIIEKEQL